MGDRNDGLQAKGSGVQDAPPPLNVQPQEVPQVEEIPLPIEEIAPKERYAPPPRRMPSVSSNESSVEAHPPEYHWLLGVLGWLAAHLWALTRASATGAIQSVNPFYLFEFAKDFKS